MFFFKKRSFQTQTKLNYTFVVFYKQSTLNTYHHLLPTKKIKKNMKHFSAILLLFVCLFSTPQLFAQTATSNNWETYEDEEGNFSIDFPTEPERETSEEDNEDLGKMTIIEWSATNQETENVRYSITCKISDENIIFSSPELTDAFIEGIMKGLKKDKNIELTRRRHNRQCAQNTNHSTLGSFL